MLSEKEIEAFKNGSFGVSRDGRKARYIGENKNGSPIIARFCKDGTFDSTHIYTTSFVFSEGIETHFDIVGLWEDKPEPFDLERALAGEPVLLRNQSKGHILKQIDDTFIGYFDHSSPISWGLDGSRSQAADSSFDIIGMWKEPENAQANAQAQYKEMPKPIEEFGDLEKVWLVGSMPSRLYPTYYSSKNFNDLDVKLRLQNKQLFATEEHAQLWCDALSGKLKVAIVD